MQYKFNFLKVVLCLYACGFLNVQYFSVAFRVPLLNAEEISTTDGADDTSSSSTDLIVVDDGPSQAEIEYQQATEETFHALRDIFRHPHLDNFETKYKLLNEYVLVLGRYKLNNSAELILTHAETFLRELPSILQNSNNDPSVFAQFILSANTLISAGFKEVNQSGNLYNVADTSRLEALKGTFDDYLVYVQKILNFQTEVNINGTQTKLAGIAQTFSYALEKALKASRLEKRKRLDVRPDPFNPGRILNFDKALNFLDEEIYAPSPTRNTLRETSDITSALIQLSALGQPEVEKKFVEWSIEDKAARTRKAPRRLWMMGLPGVGKDSYAEAYVRALHGGAASAVQDHFFRISAMEDKSALWEILGSPTGYHGSEKELSPLVKFAVLHSGGRLIIEKDEKGKEYVVEATPAANADTLNQYRPDQGVIFFNDFDNSDGQIVNSWLLEFLESGRIKIRSPGPGLKDIYVPLTSIFASNHMQDSIRPNAHKGKNGPTFEEMMDRWNDNAKNFSRIRKKILEHNKPKVGRISGSLQPLKTQFVDRFDDSELFLLRPLSPEVIFEITQSKVKAHLKTIAELAPAIGKFKLNISDEELRFLSTYNRKADEGARRIDAIVEKFLKNALMKALLDETISPSDGNEERTFDVRFKFDPKSGEAVSEFTDTNQKSYSIVVESAQPMHNFLSEESRKKYQDFEVSFRKNYFGGEKVLQLLLQNIVLGEAERSRNGEGNKARRFYFDGLSSTGKTQAAKELQRHFYGEPDDLAIIDFNNIRSREQLIEKIFGADNGEPSEFMKKYDEKSGKLVILFDEIGNISDPNILVPLYALLDEANPRFNDGEPRDMSNVVIIMTGNATEGIYKGIPREIPRDVQRRAMHEIYEKFSSNENAKRMLLETRFRQAFLNRIGTFGTLIFGPLEDQALRELLQFKLKKLVKEVNQSVEPNENRIVFDSKDSFNSLIRDFEDNVFSTWEQGRSVDNFFEQFKASLLLATERFQPTSGEDIVLSYDAFDIGEMKPGTISYETRMNFTLKSDRGELKFFQKGVDLPHTADKVREKYIQTAVHEVGHDLARAALLEEYQRSTRVSIIPGVAEIGAEFIYYAGVAEHINRKERYTTREGVLAEMAVLIAGGEAQRLVNRGGVSDGGHSNDLERVNLIAKRSILDLHLLSDDGMLGPSIDQTLDEYIKSLSEEQRNKLDEAASGLIRDARAMARKALQMNFKLLFALTKELAIRGDMSGDEIREVYARNGGVRSYWGSSWQRKLQIMSQKNVWLSWVGKYLQRQNGIALEPIKAFNKLFEGAVIANPDEILAQRKKDRLVASEASIDIPLAEGDPKLQALVTKNAVSSCRSALGGD